MKGSEVRQGYQGYAVGVDARVWEMVKGLSEERGMRRRVRLLQSGRITVPMTWGTFKPVLMLPAACGEWTDDDLRAALEHELAHISHCDAARRWLATLVSALWWPQPLVWIAGKAWRLEQERACDDAVVRSGADTAHYASQLVNAARSVRLGSFQSVAALVMAMPSGLETRLRAVVGANVNRSATGRAAFLATVAAGSLVVTICAVCQAQTEPPSKADSRLIRVTTKFVEAPVADVTARHPALKKAMEGKPVTLSEAGMQELMRQLSQKKGVDLMSAPSVTTRSGQKATVEVVREFIYPTEFEITDGHFSPTTFEMMPIGVSVEIDPSLQSDRLIQMKPATATVNEFLGFLIGGRENLKADGKGRWRFNDTRKFVGRANMAPTSRTIGRITSVTAIIDKLKLEVKKGEVAKPVFSTKKWSAEVSLEEGEWIVSCLTGGNDADAKEGKRIWFFASAEEVKGDTNQPATPLGTEKSAKNGPTAKGIPLPGGASAVFDPAATQLIVKNTTDELRDIEKILEKSSPAEALLLRSSLEKLKTTLQHLDGGLLDDKTAADLKLALAKVEIAAAKLRARAFVKNLENRARRILLPQVEFSGATIEEAVHYLQTKGRQFDPTLNIVLKKPDGKATPMLSLSLKHVPLWAALHEVAELAGMRVGIGEDAIVIKPVGATTAQLNANAPAAPGKIELVGKTVDHDQATGVTTATGDARATTPLFDAKAGKLRYDPKTGILEATGTFEIIRGKNIQLSNVPASRAVIDVNTDEIRVYGPSKTKIVN